MAKNNTKLSALSERISHKQTKQENYKKFDNANQVLGIEEDRETVIRKSYALTRQDIDNIQRIKEKGLNKRLVLSESQVIRIGIKLANDLSEAKLAEESEHIPKLPAGRPKKK